MKKINRFLTKLMSLFLAVGMLAGIAPETTYAASTDTISVTGTYNYTMANSVLTEVNNQRSKAGLSKLTQDKTLTSEAMKRAAELSIYYSHTRPNGSSCSTAYSKNYGGENIAAGYTSASAVMNGWMSSSGHKANILGKNYKSIGIGSFTNNGTTYWVQVFSSSSGSGASNSGSSSKTVSVSAKSSYISGSLALTPASSSIKKGKTTSITAYIKNKGSSGFKAKINNSCLKWSSGSTSVATVSSSGTVTGKAKGSAKITARTNGGSASASTTITVTSDDAGTTPVSTKTNISKCTVSLSQTNYTYDGTAKKPTVTVKYGSRTLKNGTDYTVAYKNNTNAGTATVTVTGKGNYTGSVSKNFSIKKSDTTTTSAGNTNKPATATITSLKSSASGQMTLKWSKVSGVDGYVIMYSDSPNFYTTTAYDTRQYENISRDPSILTYTFSSLRKGKTYYVRMKTYKTINGKKTYSDWSSVKNVVIAK